MDEGGKKMSSKKWKGKIHGGENSDRFQAAPKFEEDCHNQKETSRYWTQPRVFQMQKVQSVLSNFEGGGPIHEHQHQKDLPNQTKIVLHQFFRDLSWNL